MGIVTFTIVPPPSRCAIVSLPLHIILSLWRMLFRAVCGSLSSTGSNPGPSSSTITSLALSVFRVMTEMCIGSLQARIPCLTAFSTMGCSVSGGTRNMVCGVSKFDEKAVLKLRLLHG